MLRTIGRVFVCSLILLVGGIISVSADGRQDAPQEEPALPELIKGIPGWVQSGVPRVFKGESLYGHIDGGAELFHGYGFKKLTVYLFRPEKAGEWEKEIEAELYEMASAKAAFGVFSTKREGGEDRSARIKGEHWISRGQMNLIKGEYYVNILAPECTEEEIDVFAAALEPLIPAETAAPPAELLWLPGNNLIAGSERHIKGEPAAMNESPLLTRDFWGFKEGTTEAYSGKYQPALSKLVVIDFNRDVEDFTGQVEALFREYLSDVVSDGEVVEGRNPVGRYFLFRQSGQVAGLIMGEPDLKTARNRLRMAVTLAKSAR